MIRISKKGDYAVFVLGYLAQRGAFQSGSDNPRPLCSAHEISESTSLQHAIVANLLKDMTRAGLLESVRGTHGGYRLARAPEQITLAQILHVFEGPFSLVDCTQHVVPGENTEQQCRLEGFCPSRSPMRMLHTRIQKLMDEITLPELCGKSSAPTGLLQSSPAKK